MNFKIALAAAAVVGLAGTAQAADLAKKAPAAADYVRVCDAYGAGFFYIPGTETCLKIGGYVRAEVRTGSHTKSSVPGLGGLGPVSGMGSDRGENAVFTRARANINFDARTNTEMGLLRSYIEMWVTNNSGTAGTNGVNLRQAFVQFAGLTAGRATSNFDFIEGGYNIGNIEPDSADHRVNQLAYTFAFGNGISATLAVEDQSTADYGIATYAASSGPYAGLKWPDLVANVAIAQAWGKAQIMAALHENYSSIAAGGINSNKFGFALGAGVEVNLPMLGAGDKVFLQGFYTKGATGYAIINNPNPDLNAAGVTYTNITQDFGIVAGSIKQSTAWVINGGLNHNFTKQVEANLGASFAKYDDWANVNTFDYKQYIIGGDLRWKPVSGLTLAVALDYRHVDYANAAFKDGNQWLGTLRVQRSF